MSEQEGLGSWTDIPAERQSPRDIRQWAIIQAAQHTMVPDEILRVAARYVDFVEGPRGLEGRAPSVFRLFVAELDGTCRFLVAPSYRDLNGDLSHTMEVAQVYPTKAAAEMALRRRPMIDGRELSIGEYSE
jgi:hypothetical protein